ncbi:phage holin family protein [Sporosarcina cyprini]|uniref:phage holin family protein n=1 Tax=Sporosarcina cyprini TaxID=2910523 RepID=UPI001EE0E7FB|nr:phage holin family protein [Sporosarcina cyprini]MCG3087457.1 phage holin family protein [Sporosarcina cyprini]
MDVYLKVIPAFFSGILTFLFGGWNAMLAILLTLVVIDFITGMVASALAGRLRSHVGMLGIARKVLIFIMVTVAHLIDLILSESGIQSSEAVMTMVIVFYSINEILSITENAGRIGLPIPEAVKNAVEILRNKRDRK